MWMNENYVTIISILMEKNNGIIYILQTKEKCLNYVSLCTQTLLTVSVNSCYTVDIYSYSVRYDGNGWHTSFLVTSLHSKVANVFITYWTLLLFLAYLLHLGQYDLSFLTGAICIYVENIIRSLIYRFSHRRPNGL